MLLFLDGNFIKLLEEQTKFNDNGKADPRTVWEKKRF